MGVHKLDHALDKSFCAPHRRLGGAGADLQPAPPDGRCGECGREWDGLERGWRRYLTVDDETGLYCPECAEREFGHFGSG
jgi:hypothetical protein